MTDSYNQQNINLGESRPVVVTTPDATAVLVTLGVITDGQSLNVVMDGGGSAPGALAANQYTIDIGASATFVREAGAGAVSAGPLALIQAGGPVLLAFALVDTATETTCQLSITGPAFPYAHNLRFSAVQF
jgi:hypothetical protein